LQDRLINLNVRANEDSLKYGMGEDGSLAILSMIVGGDADAAPTESAIAQLAKVKAEVDGYTNRWTSLVTNDLPKVQQAAERQNLHVLILK
jgi:hypothetical protein